MADQTDLPNTPGIHDVSLPLGAERVVDVSISVPDELEDNAPLVVILHYGGQPSGHYGRPLLEYLFEPALRDIHAVYIAPVSLTADWSSSENIETVFSLVELAEGFYHTDPKRRVIGGYSLGAIGTWHYISLRPGFFSAAIPIAGIKRGPIERIDTPVFALHSNADELFAIDDLQRAVETLERRGADISLVTVDRIGHYDISGFVAALEQGRPWLRKIWHVAE